MATCTGAGLAPGEIFLHIKKRTLYNGRPHADPGRAQCTVCRRVVAIREKQGRAVLWHHSSHVPKGVNEAQRLRYWQRYKLLHRAPVAEPPLTYEGQVVTQVEQYPADLGNQGVNVGYNFNPYGQIRYTNITIQSDTAIPGGSGWYFSVNGGTYANPNRRMTITGPNITWTAWNNEITATSNARLQTWGNWTQPLYVVTEANVVYNVNRGYDRQYRQVERAEDLFRRVESDRRTRAEVQARALETLLSLLDPEQQAEYEQHKFFHVIGSEGTLYRIKHGSSGNIRRVRSKNEPPEAKGEAAFCVHSVSHTRREIAQEVGIVEGALPHEDHMIQQMLHLMADEKEILAKANLHWGTREPGIDYVTESGLAVAGRG